MKYLIIPTRNSIMPSGLPQGIRISSDELKKGFITILGLDPNFYRVSEETEEYVAIKNHYNGLVCEIFLEEI